MTVYIYERNPRKHLGDKVVDDYWRVKKSARAVIDRVSIVSIGIPPPKQKYNLGLAVDYEKEWCQCVPEILSTLLDETDKQKVLFLWVHAPMESGYLPEVFPYMMKEDSHLNRYHVEGVTMLEDDGYVYSWICYEFCKNGFTRMMKDDNLDFEIMRLNALVFDNKLVPDVINKSTSQVIYNLEWVVNHDAIAVEFYEHFEGCYIAGKKQTIESAIGRLNNNTALNITNV